MTVTAIGLAEILHAAGLDAPDNHAVQINLDDGTNQYVVTGARLVTGGRDEGVLVLDATHITNT